MRLEEHPTVINYRAALAAGQAPKITDRLIAEEVKAWALECGADDVGLVELERPGLAQWRESTLQAFPRSQTLISMVIGLNSANLSSTNRGLSDREYLRAFYKADRVGADLSRRLGDIGVPSLYYPAGFPMNMETWPEGMWQVSHKPVAEEAGLGKMGLHRLLIHPKLGSHVILSTVLASAPADAYDQPLDYNPCIDCKLCAAVCPVGAVGADGAFNFVNCLTHNYRDRMGGFVRWTQSLTDSKSYKEYRKGVSDGETVSMWQSLSYGICNKSSYCMAACPAGEDNIGLYLEDRKAYMKDSVNPFVDRKETIFVVPGSDAETHVAKRFPHKSIKRVSHGLRAGSAGGFLNALHLLFQPGKTKELSARYHFTFTGAEDFQGTVVIDQGKLAVMQGLQGEADLALTADANAWLDFLAKERGLLSCILSGKLRIKGNPKLMKAFAACFPM
jgi:Fe-S-cluster-containing dehydrogenase component